MVEPVRVTQPSAESTGRAAPGTGRDGPAPAAGTAVGAPPAAQPAVPSSGPPRYLRESDRIHIADRLRENASIRRIAVELGRTTSMVSREIRRDGALWRGTDWTYRPYAAQRRADLRRPRPRSGKTGQNPELRDLVRHHLTMRWSPDQICQALRTPFPDRPQMHVVHETIYQALYVQDRGELRRELTKALRTGRVLRKPRRQAQQRQPRSAHPMVVIGERPAGAADRAVPGHWEGDLIIGKDNASTIGTLVERSTRHLVLVHLPDGRATDRVRDALAETVSRLPRHLKRPLTWDQGSEMGRHHKLTAAADMPVCSCDPASPWQRGSNEKHERPATSPPNSTADHAKRSTGTPRPSASQSSRRQPADHCDATTAGMRLSAVGGVTRAASPPTS